MIIKDIKIENFFCYLDENLLEFEEGLNIVSGLNNGGKSHLFNAFYWVLFHKVFVDEKTGSQKKVWKDSDSQLINLLPENKIRFSVDQEIITTKVELNILSEFHENFEAVGEEVPYKFTREQAYRKNGEEFAKLGKSILEIEYVKDGQTKIVPLGEHFLVLDKIFPQTTRKFMWFQGETMDNLYDFSNPTTLNYAIKEISYFPLYENMFNVVKISSSSIDKKINTQYNAQRRMSAEQQTIVQDINRIQLQNEALIKKIDESKQQIEAVNESIYQEEQKVKGYDKYTDLKIKLSKVEQAIQGCFGEIESLTLASKTNLITKWMLHKCEKKIKSSEANLESVLQYINNSKDLKNPVPITLPGPEYVQKMMDDHICYICEREVEENSSAYFALQKRLEDFRNNQTLKILNDNYTDLNKAKKSLLTRMTDFKNEMQEINEEIEKKNEKKKKLLREKEAILSNSGVSSTAEIAEGSQTASQILNKINSLNNSIVALQGRIKQNEMNLDQNNYTLENLIKKRNSTFADGGLPEIPEAKAKEYIEVLYDIVEELRNKALSNLIDAIQKESNSLYKVYLGGRNQGKIIIDKGVTVVDRESGKVLTNLNTAEVLATKLAVANSFLSLSEKKMNRSFPMIADAPTSDLDHENTASFTTNLGKSFKQMIIMSKDYAIFDDEERKAFAREANVKKYYEIKKSKIDENRPSSRENEKTEITHIFN